LVYPAYVTNAPVTEITKTKSNGIRVASEVGNTFSRPRGINSLPPVHTNNSPSLTHLKK